MKNTNALGIPQPAPGQQKRPGFWELYSEAQKQMQAKAEGRPYESPFKMMQNQQKNSNNMNNLFLGDKTIA